MTDCINYFDKTITPPDYLLDDHIYRYDIKPWTEPPIIHYIKEGPTPPLYGAWVFKRCLAVGINDFKSWKEIWEDQTYNNNCIINFKNYIYNTPSYEGTVSFKYRKIQEAVRYLFSIYFGKETILGHHKLTNPNNNPTSGYSSMQESLQILCTNIDDKSVPGICDIALNYMCLLCTRSTVVNKSIILDFCGCYVEPDPLFSKIDVTSKLSPECDPICVQQQVAKKGKVVDNKVVAKTCETNVCVINDVSIINYKSSVGGIGFLQICPQCGSTGSCVCVIDAGINNIGNIAGIGNSTSFHQYCGTDSICLNIDNETQTFKRVNCEDINTMKPLEYSFKIPIIIWIIVSILIFVVIFVIIIVNKND